MNDLTQTIPQVLAKDYHYIQQLKKQLKTLPDNQPEKQQKQAKLQSVIERSAKAVLARKNSIPANLMQNLNDDLPVSKQAQTLIDAITHNQVIIVAGETGSGKTTQLPKLAMLAGRGITGQIGHTQPRRLAARSVATRISEELGEELGKTVSFKVRFTEEGTRHSIVKLMTDGILLSEMAYDKFLTRYDTIIIDEAHERSLNIDFILGYLKRLLPKRPDLKVIITSATLDTQRFAEYFESLGKKIPIINVEGRSYPIEVRYRPISADIIQSYDDDAFDEAEDNLPKTLISAVEECFLDASQKGHPNQADILIFAATEAQIRELEEVLTLKNFPHTQILPLFARQSFGEQQKIFSPSSQGRRIIIATNVAETALTVPNIRYVIDLGFARISRYNYRSRIQRLPIEAVSQAAANQRKGRCGRIGNGVCIRLYSEEDFHARPLFTEPEILRTNLASVVLQMQHLGLGQAEEFDFITPPDFRLINDAKKLLHELSAIHDKPTKTDRKKQRNKPTVLTKIGKQMAKMPIDPRLARMLIAGDEFDCLSDMLVIVSALAVQDVRERPFEKKAQADQKHALFRKEDSDFLFYIELFKVLFDSHPMHQDSPNHKLSANSRKSFAKKHYLSFPRIKEWQKTHEQLTQMMAELGFCIEKQALLEKSSHTKTQQPIKENSKHKHNVSFSPDEHESLQKIHYDNIHRALLTALLSFVAHKTDVAGEYLMTKNQKAQIFPASSLYKKGKEWLLAFEVVETSQVFMRCVAKIEPDWILSAAKDLLKYHYFEPHWAKKSAKVRAYAQISLFGLIIVQKQVVNFEQIDLPASREIFIRDALVADNYPKSLPFLVHNRQKIQQALSTEDKLRRRDLLVSEEDLYQFYDQKIPKNIASAKSFEDWLFGVGDKRLYFRDEDIMNENAKAGQDFPTVWQAGALKLPLSYIFDPSCDDDGVSVKVPVSALSQLNSVDLLWGISGWRFELVVQLLKSLPKEIRRHIVPIPDTAHKIFAQLDSNKNFGLLDQLCQSLQRLGIQVETKDFKLSAIDKYLQPLICVVDDNNRVMDKSRDIHTLQQKYQKQTQAVVLANDVGYDHFPSHFVFAQNKHRSGVVIQEFSALADAGTANIGQVVIHQFNDVKKALTTHKMGVLTLIRSTLGAKQKQLTGQIDKTFKLAFAPLGDLEKLKKLLVDATLQAVLFEQGIDFIKNNSNSQTNRIRQNLLTFDNTLYPLLSILPLNEEEFYQTQKRLHEQFLPQGQSVLATLKQIYTTWQSVRGQMLMLDTNIFKENIADIEDQLDNLCLADFVYQEDFNVWQQYPRYLKALHTRLERLPHNLDADLDAIYLLDEPMNQISKHLHDAKFSRYRWLLEEYRINLFAQPMKTLVPVSAKRLEKLWQELTTK